MRLLNVQHLHARSNTLFSSLCTIQPTVTFHGYPSVSKEVGTDVYTLSPPPESVQSGDTPSSRQWVLVGVADSSKLETPERTKDLEKLKQMKRDHGMTIVTIYLIDNYACMIR